MKQTFKIGMKKKMKFCLALLMPTLVIREFCKVRFYSLEVKFTVTIVATSQRQ